MRVVSLLGRIRLPVALALLLATTPAGARTITPELRKAIDLVAEHGSQSEARALEKLLQIEGREEIPLSKGFVDASIGRDAVDLLGRQIVRLEGLRSGRPYLARVIDALRSTQGGLDRHGYLNWGKGNTSHPSDELVLSEHVVDHQTFAKNAMGGSPAEQAARLVEHFRSLGLEVRNEGEDVVVTIAGKTSSTIVVGAHRGAADGAGVAALMEAGKAFAGGGFEKTIRLVLYSGKAPAHGAAVEAVVLVDSIARNPGRKSRVLLHSARDERALYLGSEISRAASRQGAGLELAGRLPDDRRPTSPTLMSFLKKGVPTVVVGGEDGEGDPDYAHASKVAAATLEAVARMARPLPGRIAKITTRDLPANSVFGAPVKAGLPEQNVGSVGRNEMFDERGYVRPPYAPVVRALIEQSKAANDNAAREMRIVSRDESPYRAYPRVVSGKEFATVERGLHQLERLMQAVLKDIYSPDSKLRAAGLITEDDLRVAEDFDPANVGRYGRRTKFDLLVRPDLVRNAKGEWTLLEINQGFLGGISGVLSTRQLLKQSNPQAFEGARVHAAEDFLVDMARNLKGMAKGGKVVFANFGWVAHTYDSEDKFLADELRKEGVEYVSAYTGKKLQTVRGKVYLVSPDGKKERVDVVYSRKAGGPDDLVEAHMRGNVRLFPSPGSAVLESKHFYKKLPTLIRTLLKEEPVFNFLKTRSFGKAGNELDASFLDEVMKSPERWVIKAANDAAGAGVLVGLGASKEALAKFKARILADPQAWDAQEFTAPETLNGERVDFDPYMISTKGKVLIPKSAMVRSAKMDKRFSDHPRFLDAWVLDESRPRDYLAKKAPIRAAQQRGRQRAAGAR
jgi:uncharacterized circularly permuted ATP-grasp superfamily protein